MLRRISCYVLTGIVLLSLLVALFYSGNWCVSRYMYGFQRNPVHEHSLKRKWAWQAAWTPPC